MRLIGRKTESRSPAAPPGATGHGSGDTFLPARSARRRAESIFMRLIATGGVVGVGTAIAAIMGTQDVDYWIVGLVASIVSVLIAAVLWSSRTL